MFELLFKRKWMGLKVLYYHAWKDDGLYLNSELFYIRIIYEAKVDRIRCNKFYDLHKVRYVV